MNKENILFIGANDMREIENYKDKYKRGFFIEPIPEVFEILKKNLEKCNETYQTEYQPLQYLITNEDDKETEFHIYGENNKKKETNFGNNGASSSIFQKNDKYFWENCDCNKSIFIKSIRMNTLIKRLNINIDNFDILVDVQGAELEVLKSFDNYINNIKSIKIEISKVPYYKNGVLFDELNNFLNSKNFYTKDIINKNHMDVTYIKN